jgi:protein O-GlcNAc transferase
MASPVDELREVLLEAERLDGAGDANGAIAALSRAVALRPDLTPAYVRLGTLLLDQGRLERAQDALSEAVRLDPSRSAAWVRLGLARMHSGRIREALEALERAEALAPVDAAQIGSSRLLAMHYDPALDPDTIFAAHEAWAARYAPAPDARPFSNARDRDRALRVAYVSPRFHDATVMRILEPVLRNHDARAVQAWCYAVTPVENEVTRRARPLVARWIDASGLDDEALAARLRDDAIDVAIDLAGHAPGNRLLAFARKPAPVCMSWLDYFDTTGIPAMDFLVTDPWHSPDGEQRFTEKALRLPRVRFCYEPIADAPAIAARAPGTAPVFGSFNRGAKLSAMTLTAWRLALDAAPDAKLIIKNSSLDHDEERASFSRRLATAGIVPDRVELRGFSGYNQMLGEYNDVDVVLDAFPYNGGVTTLEALWMGRPVVTIRGDTMVSRQGVALLSAAGLEDLVARDARDFARIVASLASDSARRTRLGLEMRDRLRRSPLMDASGMARALESAWRDAWHRFLA